MLYLLSLFWFIRTTKAVLFWLYLWQLKEYHIGRFLDHFRTEKGRSLWLNSLILIKIILILILFFFAAGPGFIVTIFLILFTLYFLESVQSFKSFFEKKFLKPVLTRKTALLILAGLSIEVLFILSLFLNIKNIYWFVFWFLIFDILTPLIISAIVLIFQPFAVLARSQIIKKAKKKRAGYKDLLVIGITGSYGKTSTKEFLAAILSEKFKVLKTKEHQNSEVGISQCILNDLKPEHEVFVCEMGAYNRGGIKLLCGIAKPKIGILAGINEQHMATFGSQENIICAKFELIDALPEDGVAALNWDSSLIRQTIKRKIENRSLKVKTIKYSSSEKEDFWAENIRVEKGFIAFKMFSKDGDSADFKVNVLGAYNVLNILAAACVAKELGMSLEEIAKACQKIESHQSGTQLKKGINGLNIIDATYSANPNGVISHLEYSKIWLAKKIIIMPCLIELGKSSKEVHKRIGQKIGKVCDLAVITTKERFKEIKKGAVEAGMKEENILFVENSKEIFEKIKNFCQPGDIVLLESRVPIKLINLLVK